MEDWVWRVLDESENTLISAENEDGNLHFAKAIAEKQNRILHVVVNPSVSPKRVVTVFFDRRLRNTP